MHPHLSVIIPAYNEENLIASTIRSAYAYLSAQEYSSEVIVVANNCTDRTAEIVEGLQGEHPTLRLLQFSRQAKGGTKGLAVSKGMQEARGAYRLYMDADYSAALDEISKLWPYAEEGYGVVIGSRYLPGSKITVPQKRHRVILSRLANLLVRIVLVPGIRDTQCGFKLFSADAAEKIFWRMESLGWGFDLEVLALARKYRFGIKEVPIAWGERAKGQRNRFGLLPAYWNTFKELLTIRNRV